MIWSLIKITLFVALVAAATLGAAYLLEMDGGVRIALGGSEYNLSPLKAVIAVLLLILAVWVFLKLFSLLIATLRFINGDETAISRYFNRNRERKGFEALSDGLMALASGEGRLALSKAERADRLLNRPGLTNLLTAQAAEMAGDHKKAEQTYRLLLADDRTRFVGVRGILKQRLADGDSDTALKLAQKAFALKPAHEETKDILLQLQARNKDWAGARETLRAKLKHGELPRDVHRRRDAVLALSEARDILDESADIETREAAIEANRLSPDLVPAAVMAARGYVETGKPKYAVRVLKKAWEAHPHPDIAAAFAAIEPDESPQQRIKRFQALTRIHPEDRETRLLLAELNIVAEDFPAARRALGDLAEREPDARALTVMAAIERGEGAPDAVVRGWLARALRAPRGPQWVCENCHHIHAEWVPICENCQAFDTLSWTRPPASDMAVSPGVEMLPLIVGAPDEPSTNLPAAPEGVDAEEAPPTEARPAPAPEPHSAPSSRPDPRRADPDAIADAEVVTDDLLHETGGVSDLEPGRPK